MVQMHRCCNLLFLKGYDTKAGFPRPFRQEDSILAVNNSQVNKKYCSG